MANERDSTGEWLLPVGGGPPTLYELEQRVEVALTVARAAETAALEIGAASLDAAQQARRAAELAEKASLAAVARGPAAASGNGYPAPPETAAPIEPEPEPVTPQQIFAPPPEPEPAPPPDPFQERLLAFRERAERVSVRLRRLDGATPISSA
jgi:hypothetical protein